MVMILAMSVLIVAMLAASETAEPSIATVWAPGSACAIERMESISAWSTSLVKTH